MLSCDRLRELLVYEPTTGVFTNRVTRHHRAKTGEVSGTVNANGYVDMSIDGKRYLAHRLAWLYMTGEWPKQLIDHEDGNRANNVWKNLRDESRLINQQNYRRATKASGSGLLGAFRVGKRFKSSIRAEGRVINLGCFDTAIEAHEAYVAAKRIYHRGCTI
jgi:HNH endonuclease